MYHSVSLYVSCKADRIRSRRRRRTSQGWASLAGTESCCVIFSPSVFPTSTCMYIHIITLVCLCTLSLCCICTSAVQYLCWFVWLHVSSVHTRSLSVFPGHDMSNICDVSHCTHLCCLDFKYNLCSKDPGFSGLVQERTMGIELQGVLDDSHVGPRHACNYQCKPSCATSGEHMLHLICIYCMTHVSGMVNLVAIMVPADPGSCYSFDDTWRPEACTMRHINAQHQNPAVTVCVCWAHSATSIQKASNADLRSPQTPRILKKGQH